MLAGRVRDRELIEDLTQETLVRVASAQARLDREALVPYAIVTARNVLASHARSESVKSRHAHRLVDYRGFEGPEQLVLEREETDALAVALDRLDVEDRSLLVRHEGDGVDLETLAAEAETSRGAIAMRLARARAVLRLEFLLAFRNERLSSDRCRSVLLALSAGDRRRQRHLDAAGHLLRCPTCSRLAEPVTSRDRGAAGWLIVPIGEAIRRVVDSVVRRPLQVALCMTTAAGITVGVISLRADDQPTAPVAAAETAAPTAAAVATSPATAPEPSTAPSTASEPSTAPSTVDRCGTEDPLGVGAPTVGCTFAPTLLRVDDVPVDEGFWASSSGGPAMWVRLTGVGESPVDVDAGDEFTASGTVRQVTRDAIANLSAAGRARVRDLGYYLEVAPRDISR